MKILPYSIIYDHAMPSFFVGKKAYSRDRQSEATVRLRRKRCRSAVLNRTGPWRRRIGDSKESLPTLHNGVVHGNNASLKPAILVMEKQDDALHLGQHLVNIDNIVEQKQSASEYGSGY